MTGLPQLKPVSIRQTVGDAIRTALLGGQFRPGQALSEVSLAAEMKVSRGPVREALLMLAQEGLVRHSQNYGFSVPTLSDHECREVQQVRLPLEILALDLARPRIGASDVRQLGVLKNRMIEAYMNRNLIDCAGYDMSFHSLIWERSGNARLASTLSALLGPYFAYGSAFNVSRPDLTPELLAHQHDVYIDFLTGKSERTAEQAVCYHAVL